MAKVSLSSPVSVIPGIGPAAADRLARLDVTTVYDLINFLPFRYNDWSRVGSVYDAREGDEISFPCVVMTAPNTNIRSRARPTTFYVGDGHMRILLTFFNSPYITRKFAVGDECFVHGKVTLFGTKLQMVNPYIEKKSKVSPDALIRPVYHMTEGLKASFLPKWIKSAIDLCKDEMVCVIPDEIMQREGFVSPAEAYYNVHFPRSFEESEKARRQIAYEELILLGIGMKLAGQGQAEGEVAQRVIPKGSGALSDDIKTRWKGIIGNLGFKLTEDQVRAVKEIQMDLQRSVPMNRLVQGDVGSGKTAVAVLTMAMTALMGKQSVLLAPTSVLAKQHYDTATKLLEGSGINVVLLLGKTKQSSKNEIKAQLAAGEASVIIGTHALLNDDIKFKDLALVIADEQHRFGVKQREKLLIKPDDGSGVNSVHNLVMTATPIPRTLALVLYGDMATSTIRQKPAGRQKITTWFVPSKESSDITDVIRTKLEAGEQAYIVCAKIDDETSDPNVVTQYSDIPDSGITSVMQMKENLDKMGLTRDYSAEVLYGSMNEQQKLGVMERFLSGEIKILISTTVIEVGVDNPNANVMVIMDADRFGLSTLHQLRGRIGRGDKKAFCILVSETRSELALTRMKMMCESDDGFELASKDLELRGPGDFFGTRQHGIPQLRAANLYTDIGIAKEACDAVNRVFDLGGEEADRLKDAISRMYQLRFAGKMEAL
ncbi:MAG: ATP-dependent DNA helicase RecG [Saccharofermentans sp.]|nr:ATP-dependent DNA helicase RecG [Saccharofermentans sp.]